MLQKIFTTPKNRQFQQNENLPESAYIQDQSGHIIVLRWP